MRHWLGTLVGSNWSRPHWRILYYHAVLHEQRTRFIEHLDWFSRQFRWCGVSEGVAAIRSGQLDGPLLSLTFDDADQTVYDVVLPALAGRGIRACVYVVPTYVDRGQSYRDRNPRPIMTWPQLREWVAAGHEVGSHTYTHANCRLCTDERLRQEGDWSRREIEDSLGIAVRHFAYPWGQNSANSRRVLRNLGGYDSLATIHRGAMSTGHDAFDLYRDRADLSRRADEVDFIMRMSDRCYGLRHMAPSALKRRWQRRNPVELCGPFRSYENHN